ncbi:amidase [Pseudidiomarina aestuarii]|uniref:amidase n=1 Tax=Pseudidiomarina aestuarii TaxID=624146 RepID=UPI003A970B48
MKKWFVGYLFALLLSVGAIAHAAVATELDLQELSVEQLQQGMAAGDFTSVDVVNFYLARIYQHNQDGANLRAVNTLLDTEALHDIAKKLDAERAAGNVRGPLHGIPVLLKDNIDTADGMPNTGGSWLLREHFAPDDAFIVQRLRAAGAIIMGKANLSEWANFRSTASASGWSSFGGQVKNPFDTSRTACGSSSGSAVAVSANFVALAVGTETDGSLTCPATINGVVTIKPTVGLLSRDGIIPISSSQDTAGPLTRTVRDAVYLLSAMTGQDSADAASFDSEVDFTAHLKADGLRGKRIGIVRELTGYHAGVDALFEQQLVVLREAGAEVVDDLSFPNGRNWGGDEFTVLLHEFKADMQSYFEASPHPDYTTLSDLIAANQAHASRVMPWFGQELFEMAEQRTAKQQEAYEQARADAKRKAGAEGIDALLAAHDLDLLIAPTGGPAWKTDLNTGDHFLGSASGAAAVAGYPHISVPMGFVHHLPIGLSFFGTAKSEPILIEAAYDFEQRTQARRAPQLTAPF